MARVKKIRISICLAAATALVLAGCGGKEKGIYVQSYSQGSVPDLVSAVRDSIAGKVGAEAMPDIFSSYADTAHEVEQAGAPADLSRYLSEEELDQYVDSYVEEGCIAADGTLRIFPIAKSTEIMMINRTDWEPFAQATQTDTHMVLCGQDADQSGAHQSAG